MTATNTGLGPVAIQAPGQKTRAEFNATEMSTSAETASSALAVQARAAVEARFVMAMQRPRDMEKVRVKILAACKRPAFAETAIYAKPVGKKQDDHGNWVEAFAEGLSIRFAEEAIRCLGNAMTETTSLYDDGKKRIVRVSATDFENNVVHYKDLSIDKTVERKKLKQNQAALGTRQNSYGDLVFIVEATEDELAKKEGANVAKALRDKILMLLPSDIQEEARRQVRKTEADEDAKDPDEAKRRLIDAFAELGVMPDQLAAYIGHDLGAVQPADMKRLRAVYAGIKEGETTWAEVAAQKQDAAPAAPAAPADGAATTKPVSVDEAAARSKAKREAKAKDAKPAADEAPGSVAGDMPAWAGPGPKPPTVAHDPKTGEVTPPASAATTPAMSTRAQQKEIAELLVDRTMAAHEVVEKYGVPSTSALSFAQAEEAKAWLLGIPVTEPGSEG